MILPKCLRLTWISFFLSLSPLNTICEWIRMVWPLDTLYIFVVRAWWDVSSSSSCCVTTSLPSGNDPSIWTPVRWTGLRRSSYTTNTHTRMLSNIEGNTWNCFGNRKKKRNSLSVNLLAAMIICWSNEGHSAWPVFVHPFTTPHPIRVFFTEYSTLICFRRRRCCVRSIRNPRWSPRNAQCASSADPMAQTPPEISSRNSRQRIQPTNNIGKSNSKRA